MKKFLLLLFAFSLVMSSCSSTKSASNNSKSNTTADRVIANAYKYIGTKYKYGGTSRNGMDCSGLVYTAFGEENIQLPRVSRDMAKKGKNISLRRVERGDLLFFKTDRSSRINHVGLVSYAKDGVVKFIHSTNSRGVIESSILQKYWNNAYTKATKVLK